MNDAQIDIAPSRTTHVAWCKGRALLYVDQGRLAKAVASMVSDVDKYAGCRIDTSIALLGLVDALSEDAEALRRWIEGFA